MNKLLNLSDLKQIKRYFNLLFIRLTLVVWTGLILLTTLYVGQNEGGNGLNLPFNIVVWTVVCLFIVVTFAKVLYDQYLVVSKVAFYFFTMLLAIFVLGSLQASIPSDTWWRMAFGFSVLSLFLWALFQYSLTQHQLVQILIILCVVGFVQALIAIVQSHDAYRVVYTLIPYEAFRFSGGRPFGTFQQVNMLASFLALVLVSALYLMLSRYFLTASRLFKVWLFCVVLLSFYVLLLSGSRAGFLAFMVGVFCMLVARQTFIKRHLIVFLVWLLALSWAFLLSVYFPGLAGSLDVLVTKMAGLSGGARVSLYQYSLEMFMLSPFVGLGIGNFIEPFADYIRAQQNTQLMPLYFTHPHNEWLYWMLQSGMVALFAPLFFAVFYLMNVFKRGYSHALMVLALMLPFLIQSQLSYPFTLSSIHLFILIFFIYVGVRFVRSKRSFVLHRHLKRFLLLGVLSLIPVILYASWHTLKSIQEVYIFENSLFYTQFQTKEEIAHQRYLEHATYNILYRESVVIAMNKMVIKAIKSNNRYDLNQFIWWAEKRGGEISQQSLENLAKVYLAQGKLSQVDKVVEELLSTYGVVLTRAELQQDLALIKAKKLETDLK